MDTAKTPPKAKKGWIIIKIVQDRLFYLLLVTLILSAALNAYLLRKNAGTLDQDTKQAKVTQISNPSLDEKIKELNIKFHNTNDLPDSIVDSKIFYEQNLKIYIRDGLKNEDILIFEGYGKFPAVSQNAKKIAFYLTEPNMEWSKDPRLFSGVFGLAIYDIESKVVSNYQFDAEKTTPGGQIHWLSNSVLALEMIADPEYYVIYSFPEFQFITFTDNLPYYIKDNNSLLYRINGTGYAPHPVPSGISLFLLDTIEEKVLLAPSNNLDIIHTSYIDIITGEGVSFRKIIEKYEFNEEKPFSSELLSTKEEYWEMEIDGSNQKQIFPYELDSETNKYIRHADILEDSRRLKGQIGVAFLAEHPRDDKWAYFILSNVPEPSRCTGEILVLANVQDVQQRMYKIAEGTCFGIFDTEQEIDKHLY